MNRDGLLVGGLSLLFLASSVAFAQDEGPMPPPTRPLVQRRQPQAAEPRIVTLPAGTKVPMSLRHPITTKTAREGDSVYAVTSFPVVLEDQIVIPEGTYVQGEITQVKRAGKVKGRAELVVHFRTMIFPSGYTVQLSGAIDSVPGSESGRVKDKEGTIEGDSSKGKDAEKIGKATGVGAGVGSVAGISRGRSLSGMGIGGAAGAAVGLGAVLFTRGPDVRFEVGSMMETVLERPLDVDMNRVGYPRRPFFFNGQPVRYERRQLPSEQE